MMMELSEVLAKKYLERQEARVRLDAANEQNVSLKEPEALPDATKPLTYFGMSFNSCIEQQRLELFWSILGECIEERKTFIFQSENEEEANELRIFTWTLVFQYSDRWEVLLDDLIVKAKPPRSNAVPNTN
jgi:hypothetical protein